MNKALVKYCKSLRTVWYKASDAVCKVSVCRIENSHKKTTWHEQAFSLIWGGAGWPAGQTKCLQAEKHHGKRRKLLPGIVAGSKDSRWHHFLSELLLECGAGSDRQIRGQNSQRETGRQEGRSSQEERGEPPHATAEGSKVTSGYQGIAFWFVTMETVEVSSSCCVCETLKQTQPTILWDHQESRSRLSSMNVLLSSCWTSTVR